MGKVRKHKRRKKRKKNPLVEKVASFLKEAVKVPVEGEDEEPEQKQKPEPPKKPKQRKIPRVKRSELPDLKSLKPPKEEVEVVSDMDEGQRREIVGALSDAAKKWKKTGDTGLRLKPHVTLKERVNQLWSTITTNVSRELSKKLKKHQKEVQKRTQARVKEAEKAGKKVDTARIVREEWRDIVQKMQGSGDDKEREEIEKIYKQLEGK